MSNEDVSLEQWFEANGGVASVADIADLLDVDPNLVRRYARESGSVARVGTTFVYTLATAEEFSESLRDEDDDEDDEDEDGEDEDGEDEDGEDEDGEDAA